MFCKIQYNLVKKSWDNEHHLLMERLENTREMWKAFASSISVANLQAN